MTSRQRLLAAYARQPVDRIPCSPRVWAWMREFYGDARPETLLRMAREFGFDPHFAVGVFPQPVGLTPTVDYHLPGVRAAAVEEGFDGDLRVVRRIFETPAGTLTDVTKIPPPGNRAFGISPNPIRSEFLVKSRNDLEPLQFLLPDPAAVSLAPYFETERLFGERGLVMLNIMSPLCHRAGDALAMEDLMVAYYQDRDFFERLLDMFHRQMLAEADAAIRAGVKHFFANWYYNSLSAGWSPAIWREVFAPQLAELCGRIHAAGGTVNFYDDGKFMPILTLLADCGIDVLQTLTPPPVGDADLPAIKHRIGDRVCLMGYVDLIHVVQHGTPEIIEQTVKYAVETAGPTGFILGSSDSFRDGTPLANIRAYFAAAEKYGAPPRHEA